MSQGWLVKDIMLGNALVDLYAKCGMLTKAEETLEELPIRNVVSWTAIIAGYACQVNFSPDGRFVMSGDGEGRCWFWDWKSCKVFRTLNCHEGVCIGCEWHPLEQSKVATCGWDGLIKYW